MTRYLRAHPHRRLLAFCLLVLSLGIGAALLAADDRGPLPGIDLAAMDRSVVPGDDFYGYANGAWQRRVEIPPDRSRWGIFDILGDKSLDECRAIVEHARTLASPTPIERKVGEYYASYVDEARIEARGLSPVQPALARIAALDGVPALSRALGEQLAADVDPLNNTNFHTPHLLGMWVAPSLDDPGRYVPYLLQGGIDMPDREYYTADSARMKDIRAAFAKHVESVLTLAGVSEPAARAARVVALEEQIAMVHASRLESLDVTTANNPWPRAEFSTRAPGIDWQAFFAAARLDGVPTLIAWHPKAITGLSALVAKAPLDSWKDWLTFHAIDDYAGVLPKTFVEERFAFHGKVLSGTPQLSPRWKRGIASVDAALGEALGQLYVAKHFPPERKAQLQAMVAAIVAAFGRRIDRLEWMTPATKTRAKEKLGTLYVGIGYPEHWIDYSDFEVVAGDAYGNAVRAERFEYRRSLAKLDKPVDKTEWSMTPQTVNAVNLPLQNALNFPAAILRPPFFDPQATAAVNYGDIGATIGHEISHSFDDQGAMFDASGKLANWWTKADLAHFEASGAQLAAQYDKYAPFPDLHVNGKQTLSENIADLAGLAAAHDAWQASLGGAKAPVEGGLTGEQQFFIAYAQSWRAKAREPALRQQVIVDGHAPDQYRAATVRNHDAWYDAFLVKPGQALYLPPADRVTIW